MGREREKEKESDRDKHKVEEAEARQGQGGVKSKEGWQRGEEQHRRGVQHFLGLHGARPIRGAKQPEGRPCLNEKVQSWSRIFEEASRGCFPGCLQISSQVLKITVKVAIAV